MLSSSKDRGSFQANNSRERGNDAIADMLEELQNERRQHEESDEWKQNNLEYDLRSTDWILQKTRSDEVYAQQLYAALCNNSFYKLSPDEDEQIIQLLKDEYPEWSCSWRYAGGIVADMRQEGDYIDWYCSGIRGNPIDDDEFQNLNKEEQENWLKMKAYVPEGTVTDEIQDDLKQLGWRVTES